METARTKGAGVTSGPGGRLDVAVLVDLYLEPSAGGHVKAWERFARAACAFPDALDLTVYFLGAEETEAALCDTVRLRTVPPAIGTRNIFFLRQGGGDTDLGRYNRALARRLQAHGLIHATSAFAFGRTGLNAARARGLPFVYSVHTDVPALTRVYAPEVIGNFLGRNALSRSLGARVGEANAKAQEKRIASLWTQARRVIVSNEADRQKAAEVVPATRIAHLRRGIDKALFSPEKRDREWLAQTYDIAPGEVLALFVGRIDETKRVLTAARAVRHLAADGLPVRFVTAGKGAAEAAIAAELGARASLLGHLDPEILARVMASCDLFVFPSLSETVGNVAIEAKACGLPLLLSARGRTMQCLGANGVDGVAVEDGGDESRAPARWAEAMRPLITDRDRRLAMSAAARAHIEQAWPSWEDVVGEDLIPVWRAVMDEAAADNAVKRV